MFIRIILFIILSLIPLTVEAVNYCNDLNTAGAWKLDETSGNYLDCTTNANTGVITGTVNQSATLKYGYAAGFSNTNNTNVSFGSNTVIDNIWDSGATVSFWAGLDSAGTAGGFCTGGTLLAKANWDGWSICVNTDGSLAFTSKWAGGNVVWTSTETPFSAFDGTAKHVMIYYNTDSTLNNPTVKVGCTNQTMTASDTRTAPRNTDSSFNLLMGLDGETTNTGELDGKVDDVLIYNGDLTSSCSDVGSYGIDGSAGGGGGGGVESGTGKVLYGEFYGEI